MTPEELREVEAWLAQHTAAREQLDQQTAAAVLAAYAGVNFYSQQAIDEAVEQAADTSDIATVLAAGMMAQYLASVTSIMSGEDLPAPSVLLPPLRNGADMRRVFQRPIKMFRRKVSEGMPPAEAYAQAMRYAAGLTEGNNTAAMREAARQALTEMAGTAGITGYRRILRPELSKTGSCGLCIAASDQVYRTSELMPIHPPSCNCDVLPIVGAKNGAGDPGNSFNNLDLGTLYADAGSTSTRDLAKVRYAVNEHGEFGPVLTVKGQKFTGPEEVAAREAAAA